MSSDNEPSPQKQASSSFADVFKTLAAGRRKSLSPLSVPENGGDLISHGTDGRRSSRANVGFDTMQRGSIVSSSSDSSMALEFEVVHRNLQHPQTALMGAEEAETIAKILHKYSPEQSLALWQAASPLIYDEDSDEVRRRASRLLEAVAGRQDLSPEMKHHVCESLLIPTASDVIPARVNALISLSDNGRRLDFTDLSILSALATCLHQLYKAVAQARSKAKKNKTPRQNGSRYDDDANLDQLLEFIVNTITLQNKPASEEDIGLLLKEVCYVCKKTSVALDLKNSLAVFDAIVLSAQVPEASFVQLLEVLSSIHASVKSLSGPTSRVVRNLAKSARQATMIEYLHSFLQEDAESQGRNLNVVRGAIDIFTDLIRAYGQDGLPEISFPDLVKSLHNVATREDVRIHADILELCVGMLDTEYASICLLEQDWSGLVELLVLCSRHVAKEHQDSLSSLSKTVTQDDARLSMTANISRLVALVEGYWDELSDRQRSEMGRLLMVVHRQLSLSQAKLLFHLIAVGRRCFPGEEGWKSESTWLIQSFLQASDKESEVRIVALDTFRDAILHPQALSAFEQAGLFTLLLEDFADEKDLLYLEALVSLMVEAGIVGGDELLHTIVDTLSLPMTYDSRDEDELFTKTIPPTESKRSSTASSSDSSLSNVCIIGLVRLFLSFLNVSAGRAGLLFETLIFIMKTWKNRPSDALVTVLKLLFRLRCDSAGAVIVVPDSENDFLVAVLSRTLDIGMKQGQIGEALSIERSSISDETLVAHTGRMSLREQSNSSALPKSMARVSSSQSRTMKLTPPSWTNVGSRGLPCEPPAVPSPFIYAYKPSDEEGEPIDQNSTATLKINVYLETIIDLLQRRETDWDVYSYILAHLGPQLSNRNLFSNAVPQIQMLRNILCSHIKGENFREAPSSSGIKKADVATCIFESLTMLIGYHGHFAKSEQDELVRAFMLGIGSWDGTSRGCIHALSVCCHEMPLSVTKSLNAILDKMSKVITMSQLAVHILEFLALLARLPDVYVNLREEEIRTVFGMCIRFIQTTREQRHKAAESPVSRGNIISTRFSGGLRELAAAQTESSDTRWQEGVSRYVYALTYNVLVFWFLSLKLQDRAKHVNWITSRLIFTDEHGTELVEEQSEVFIDLMQRVTYSDLGDTIPYETFPPSPEHGPVVQRSWIVGLSIVTVETAQVSGLSQITKRMASGTTYAEYRQRTAPVLPHQVPPSPDPLARSDVNNRTAVLPNHILLQLTTTAFPTPRVVQPIPLPDDDMTRRAINSFDRNDIVDGYKIGVIFVDRNQTTESEILANTRGSPDYEHFLAGLGTRVSIRNAQFNTQGLHADTDGEFTYAWRDRVTEVVYHVTTMMPTNLETDPHCINKKRHIGNDFVNIVFNRSNVPFNFDTIPSQFSSVNIVITPVSRIAESDYGEPDEDDSQDYDKHFYLVKVMAKPGLPEFSPAAMAKVISGENLAAYVRILAMNGSVFSLVWNLQGGEHISSWRNRLREIKRLRERVQSPQTQFTEVGDSGFLGYRRNTRANIHSEDVVSRVTPRTDFNSEWKAASDNNVFQALDFSRWTR
jgi:hypothetical protein